MSGLRPEKLWTIEFFMGLFRFLLEFFVDPKGCDIMSRCNDSAFIQAYIELFKTVIILLVRCRGSFYHLSLSLS